MKPEIKVKIEIDHVVLETALNDDAKNGALIMFLKMCNDSIAEKNMKEFKKMQAACREAITAKHEIPT